MTALWKFGEPTTASVRDESILLDGFFFRTTNISPAGALAQAFTVRRIKFKESRLMVRGSKFMIVLVVATLGIWGCAQGNSSSSGQAERIHSLENKCAKLEDDYRAAATVRDQARKKVASLEEERTQLLQDLEAQRKQLASEQEAAKLVTKERNELRITMENRTTERDLYQARCDKLKKGLQALIGQDDALSSAPTPTTAIGTTALGGRSE